MNLFKNFFRRSVGGTLVTSVQPKSLVANRNVVQVTSASMALKVAAVYRCVDILSSGVATLPFEKKRLNRAFNCFQTDTTDRTNYLIGMKPNRHMTAYELKRNAVIQMVLQGNAYIYPNRVGGELSELVLLAPNTVSHDTLADVYHVSDTQNNIFGVFMPEDIIHLRGMSLDGGRSGVSLLTYASTVLGISASADAESLNMFARGGRIKGFVSNDKSTRGFGEYQDKELHNLAVGLQRELDTGADILVLPGQCDFTSIQMTSADMQLLEQKKFGVEEIARIFGVPVEKLYLQQPTNYKSAEMSQVNFLNDTLRPILVKIENEFNAKLINESFWNEFKFEFDTMPMFTTDLTTEAAYMTQTISAGVMTINEWRRKKNLRPINGGDTTLVSCNVAPVDSPKISGETGKNQQS